MPFRTEHSARVRNPDDFIEKSIRRKNISSGVDIIIGKLKSDPDGSMVVQAYRFKVSKFTPQEAKKWMKKEGKKYILFEEAKPENTSKGQESPTTPTQDSDKDKLLSDIFGKNRLVRNVGKKKPERGRWFDKEYSKPEQNQNKE